MPSIPFVKASACGNDFLLVDGSAVASGWEEATRRLCDRHDGVGADGVEWLYPTQDADIEIRLINADGSHAEISGNGTRCVAAMICADRGKEKINIRTEAGLKTCTLMARNENDFEFEAAMGAARVDRKLQVTASFGLVAGVSVSIGNPHFVWFVHDFPADWQQRAAEIQRDPQFKQGINVELVQVENKSEIHVRFFERGAGETRSSGTGSCASAVASIASGRAESPVKVQGPGGAQTVRLENGNVFLRGPARIICRGEFYL